jgi:hypothetical protein
VPHLLALPARLLKPVLSDPACRCYAASALGRRTPR